jgi:hypothetical protein
MMNYLFYLICFGMACSALMIIVFRPAWQEWRHPSDLEPLNIMGDYFVNIDFFAENFRTKALAFISNRLTRDKNEFRFAPAEYSNMDWTELDAPVIAMQPIYSSEPIECKFPIFIDGDIDATASNRLTALYTQGAAHLGRDTDISDWAHSEADFFLGAGSNASRRISSATAVELDNECVFERISAPVIRFGQRRRNESSREHGSLIEASFADLKGAVLRTDQMFMIKGDCDLPGGCIYRGSLIVTGKLNVGKGTRIIGDVKARKGIVIGENALIGGSLVCENQIQIRDHAMIKGPVISESIIAIGNNVTIGVIELPTTISAEKIIVQSGVITHGAVWARTVGLVWEN